MAAAAVAATGDAAVAVSTEGLEAAVLGAGCFWCVEAVFSQMAGVKKVESGYAGGKVENPSYEAVCTGTTDHAEVIKVWFDPKETTFANVLKTFFKSHDPTTLNSQGADRGTQYRSAIFYGSEAQRDVAKEVIKELTDAAAFDSPIVTEVTPGEGVDSKFLYYRAEDYHQDYYKRNPEQGYCRAVIRPKLSKLGLRF